MRSSRGSALLFWIPAVLLLAVLLVVIASNAGPVVTVSFIEERWDMSLGLFGVAVALLSATVMLLLVAPRFGSTRHQTLRAELHREKAEVTAESSSKQVMALESKVATLEKALDKALTRSK